MKFSRGFGLIGMSCCVILFLTLGSLNILLAQTDIDGNGFQDFGLKEADTSKNDEQRFTATLGATNAVGNINQFSLLAGSEFVKRAQNNKFTVLGNLMMAYDKLDVIDSNTGETKKDWEKTAEAWSGGGRYDYFFTANNSLFAFLGGAGNEFAGFDYRINAQFGYHRDIINNGKHLLTGEVGYDYTHENRIAGLVDADGNPIDETEDSHSARLYSIYGYTLSPTSNLSQDAELLVDMTDTANTRIKAVTALTGALTSYMSLQLSNTLTYDNQPVPGFKEYDNLSAVNLIINIINQKAKK